MAGLTRLWWPEASRRLLVDEGEFIVEEVAKHWVVQVVPVLIVVAGMLAFVLMPLAPSLWALSLLIGLVLGAFGFYRVHVEFMDRFVITNMRVFRVHGVVDQHLSTMPIARILDISIQRTFLGHLLGYGHFVFESAAQDQGLREIRFVPHVEQRHQTIQRVIERAGLRARLERADDWDGL